METILSIYKYLFPFLLGITLFSLYQKQYRFMRRFYGRMTLYWKARKFYMLVIFTLLLLYNYTHYVAGCGRLGILSSAVFMSPLLFYRVADRWMHLLHEYVGHLLLLIFVALAIALAEDMTVTSVTLLTIGVASMFYPSEHVLKLKSNPEFFPLSSHTIDMIARNYYAKPTRQLAPNTETPCSK
mgnify:CR=1 FL=1